MSSQDKKPKHYYVDYTKQRRFRQNRRGRGAAGPSNNSRFRDVPDFGQGGHKGFLITSADEVKSYFEMRNVFERYFHEIYDDESEDESDCDKLRDQTTEDELESELSHLRQSRPFKQIKTHCRNAIFLNIVEEFRRIDPVVFVDRFFDEMTEKRTSMTSFTYKVLPVYNTFRNNVASAKEAVINLLWRTFLFEEEAKNYFIEFQTRGNYKLESEDKQKMIEGVADAVTQVRPRWKVNREKVDYMIVLVALRDICCLSIVSKYFERCKYNVIELCKEFSPAEATDQAAEESGTIQDDEA